MGGEKNGEVLLPSQIGDDPPEQIACLRVEPGGRLVEDQDLRLVQECAGNVDAPPLTAGELADRAAEQVFKIEQSRELCEPRAECRAVYAVQRRAAFQIVFDRQVLIEDGVLKYNAQRALDAVTVSVTPLSI